MDSSILLRITILEQQIALLTSSKYNTLYPTKRTTAYSLFSYSMRDDAKATLQSLNIPFNQHHVNREIASMWKSISHEERTLWNTHATNIHTPTHT